MQVPLTAAIVLPLLVLGRRIPKGQLQCCIYLDAYDAIRTLLRWLWSSDCFFLTQRVACFDLSSGFL